MMPDSPRPTFPAVEAVQEVFARQDYLADRPLALTVKLATDLEKPMLLEGEAGVGTFTARHPPYVVLTSSRTRELNDALKRRCLYLWIDYPSPDKEREIILRRVSGVRESLADGIAAVMHTLRQVDFYKRPGIAETLDGSRALLGVNALQPGVIEETAGCILKYRDDIQRLRASRLEKILVGEGTEERTTRGQ